MNKDYTTKIVFNSKLSGQTIILENIEDEDKVVKRMNASTGIGNFPTAKLEITPTQQYSKLIGLKNGDEVSIEFSQADKTYKKIHQGKLSTVTIKADKEKIELVVKSVSAFFQLQEHNISSTDFTIKSGLREVLAEILLICGIEEKVIVSNEISNDFEIFYIQNFPALSFINVVCYKFDLVYDFKNGEEMKISKRSEIFNKMQNQIPIVLTDDDIISSEFNQ